jgi:GT2 family glycosyltransferase
MPAQTPLVIIITLSWNRQADTLAFLASCGELRYPRLQTVVVDNGSTDGSVAAIRAAYPDVIQLCNATNLGFAAGMNVGLRYALAHNADYVFLANNDTTLAPDALDLLVRAAAAQKAAVIAPAIYYAAASEQLWWLGGTLRPLLLEVQRLAAAPSPTPFFAGVGFLPEPSPQTPLPERERGFGQHQGAEFAAAPPSPREGEGGWGDEGTSALGRDPGKNLHLKATPFPVDFVTGCGMLITRAALAQVGLFDERLFMYYEDSDFCLRVRRAGQTILVEPRAAMYHKVAQRQTNHRRARRTRRPPRPLPGVQHRPLDDALRSGFRTQATHGIQHSALIITPAAARPIPPARPPAPARTPASCLP